MAITNLSIIYIPKSGNKYHIPLSNIVEYGSQHLGTGDFTTTVSRMPGTKMHFGTTSEIKVPVFHIKTSDGNIDYWYAMKNKNFYNSLEIALGQTPEKKIANF